MAKNRRWLANAILISLAVSAGIWAWQERSLRKRCEDALAFSASTNLLVEVLLTREGPEEARAEMEKSLPRIEEVIKDLGSDNPALQNFLIFREDQGR